MTSSRQRQQLLSLFREFSESIGLHNLEISPDLRFSLVFDDNIVVEVQCDAVPQFTYLLAAVSPTPLKNDDKASIYEGLLAAPFVESIPMHGSSFMIDPESEDVLLSRTLDAASLSQQSLKTAIEQFVDAIEFWRKRLTNGVVDPSRAKPPAQQIPDNALSALQKDASSPIRV